MIACDENLEILAEEIITGNMSFALYWKYTRAGKNPLAMILFVLLFFSDSRLVCIVIQLTLSAG